MVLHALGVMEHAFEAFGDAEAALVRALLERVGAVDAMKPQHITQILSALAKLRAHPSLQGHEVALAVRQLDDRACNLLRQMPSQWNGQDTATLYHAFASLQQRPTPALMELLSARVVEIAQTQFKTQDLTNVTWAVCTGRWHLPDGAAAAAAAAAADDELELSQAPRSHLGAGAAGQGPPTVYCPVKVMRALEERTGSLMSSFGMQDFARLLWAVTQLDTYNRVLGRAAEYDGFFKLLCKGLEKLVVGREWASLTSGTTAQQVCVCVCVKCMHVCMCLCMYVWMDGCIYVCVYMCIIHTYVYVYNRGSARNRTRATSP